MDARAHWISPAGEVLPVQRKHINEVITNPSRFGMSREQIEEVYARHHEPLGLEGKAREEIIVTLVDRGWIRVRHYEQYLAVVAFDLDHFDARAHLHAFFRFAKAAYHPDTDVKLLLRNGQMKRFKFGNIEAELMG